MTPNGQILCIKYTKLPFFILKPFDFLCSFLFHYYLLGTREEPMSFELKLFFSLFFIGYFLYYIFSKNYVKTYIPFMGFGYLIGPFGWNILNIQGSETLQFFLFPATFILGLQMGKSFKSSFWKKFPLEPFFSNLLEKIILILLFLIVFFLVIPNFAVIPVSFPFYLSIVAFSSSLFFARYMQQHLKEGRFLYFEINNIIIMMLFTVFYLVFPPSLQTYAAASPALQLTFLLIYAAFLLLTIKLRIDESIFNVILWLSLILLGSALSQILGFSSIIIGFATGLFSNFASARKQIVLKRFFYFFNEYIIILFLFMAGFLMELSFPMLLLALIYLAIRIFARILMRLLNAKKISLPGFFRKDIFLLFQGEYFLAFMIIYALEYRFNQILSIALFSLLFSEILINYYHFHYKEKA